MMRLSALAICLFVIPFAVAQDWTSRGKIDSRNAEIQRRENGQVVGTEFVHYEYIVSTSLEPTDETYWLWNVWHVNRCKGKKHPDHSKCDTSCDDVDKRSWNLDMKGEGFSLPKEMRKMERDSAKIAGGLGMPGGPANWSSASSQYISQMIRECNNTKVTAVAGPHDLPCTHRYREYGLKLTKLHVRGEFWKKGFYRTRGVDTPINQMVTSHEGVVAELWYPQSEPLKVQDSVLCRCQAVPEPRKPPVLALPKGGGVFMPVPGPGGCEYETQDHQPVCPFDDQVRFVCSGQSLTEALIQIENNCGEDLICTIPMGCELFPGDSGTQVMTCTESTTVKLPAKSTVYVYVPSEPELSLLRQSVEAKLRVACTEIHKSQPTSKTKFTLKQTSDPKLKRVIDQPAGTSFFANAVTQGRVWIYKDGTTREEINKIMIPGLTEGMYLNALFGLAKSGVDLTGPKYRKCLDPKLLSGSTASKETVVWFYWQLESMDPKSADKLRGQAVSQCRQILAGTPERLDVRHVAHLALAMSDSDVKETRSAGLAVLEMPVPEALKMDFIGDGGLDVLRSVMTFGEDSEALKAIQIAKGYRNAEVKALLQGMAAWGRESIRAAAEEAAASM